MDALELCNKINMEAEPLADSGFPLEVFPQKMQSIIIDMVVHGNFKVDYVAMSMLSAASAALGNTYRIHVKQDWDTNAASLYHIGWQTWHGQNSTITACIQANSGV